MSHWNQLKIVLPSGDVDRIAEQLSALGAVSVTFEDAADAPILEPAPGTTPLWAFTRIVGLFDGATDLAAVTSAIQQTLDVPVNVEIETLAEEDWTRKWMDDFKPIHFGGQLWIVPSWLPPPDPSGVNILLDPGLAFGTGTHSSTALMMRWLAENDISNQTVIDYGCGSGILAIACAKLGAKRIFAVDHDPQAIIATQSNAKNNDVDTLIECVEPSQLADGEADLILANILAEPLIELAPRFATLAKPRGKVILAGLLTTQSRMVLKAYEGLISHMDEAHETQWHRLDLTFD